MITSRAGLTALALLAVLAGPGSAQAESASHYEIKNKPRGIFGGMGSSEEPSARRRPVFGGFDFFGNSRYQRRNPYVLEYEEPRPRTRQVTRDADMPAPDIDVPSAQTYTYVPDKLVPVADLKLPAALPGRDADRDPQAAAAGEVVPDTRLPAAVLATLRDARARIHLVKPQADAVVAFYKARDFAPLWIGSDGIGSKSSAVRAILARAGADGLDPAHYAVEVPFGTAPDALARFDVELTAAALRYAQHASGGRIVPNRLSGYHDLNPPAVAADDALLSLARHDDPAGWLAGLHPDHPAYAAMRAELAALDSERSRVADIEPIPAGPVLRLGTTDPRLALLRKRLVQLGFLAAGDRVASNSAHASDEPLFGSESLAETGLVMTEADVEAVKAFQASAGLRADGLAGPATVAALNGEPAIDRRAQIALNMERMRWLPRDLGARHIFVNQPAFELRVIDAGAIAWSTRIVVGTPSNQTAFFSDSMKTIEFNPYWGVPQSILVNEMLPRLRNDPSYLDRQGYEVIGRSGRKVASSSVDWWSYSTAAPLGVRQPPGRSNALGEVKFLFPNKHAIYLHDTPQKSLFGRDARAFSHGCVRVQNPRELVAQVLGWDQDRIAAAIATGKNTPVKLDRHLPVHLTYFTAWPDPAGKLAYYADVYRRDAHLGESLAKVDATLRPGS